MIFPTLKYLRDFSLERICRIELQVIKEVARYGKRVFGE